MTRRHLLWLLGFLAAAGVAGFAAFPAWRNSSSHAGHGANAESTSTSAGALPDIPSTTSARSPAPPVSLDARAIQRYLSRPGKLRPEETDPSRHPFPNLPRSRKGMDLASDPFGATSVEDQDWLDRNGYPNELQWTTYQSSPDEALEQAAEAGDTAAAGLLGFRKMLAGDESAYAALLESAALGDDFALELLTSYMFRNPRGPTSIPVDPKFGMALNRVMEWRGNYSAASARNAMYRDDFSTVEWIEIDAQAQQILGSFNELYRETHGPLANPVDPRPTGG